MKKLLVAFLLLVLLIFIILFLFASCTATVKKAESQQESSMFVQIEKTNFWEVVYHRETKVMYTVSRGMYNSGNFTLLVNPDGTPMIYKE